MVAVQATFVGSESTFSTSRNLIGEEGRALFDDSIAACMWMRAWERLLRKIHVHENGRIYGNLRSLHDLYGLAGQANVREQ